MAPIIDIVPLDSSWGRNAGPGIGDAIPLQYGSQSVREFDILGGPYSSWLSSINRPVLGPATGGLLSLSFELMTDGLASLAAQAIEFDTRLVIAKRVYDFGAQLNYQRGGLLQLWKGGKWTDTAFHPGKLSPWTWTPIVLGYSYDPIAFEYSFLSIRIGQASFEVSPDFHLLAAQPLAWTDTCHLQMQQDLGAKGGTFSMYLRNAQYQWSQ